MIAAAARQHMLISINIAARISWIADAAPAKVANAAINAMTAMVFSSVLMRVILSTNKWLYF